MIGVTVSKHVFALDSVRALSLAHDRIVPSLAYARSVRSLSSMIVVRGS